VASYLVGARQFTAFLQPRGRELEEASRADLEAFIAELLTSRSAATASTRTTAVALDRYLRVRARHKDAALPWLWLGLKGQLTAWGLVQMLRRRSHQAGLPDLHPQAMRTMSASYQRSRKSGGDRPGRQTASLASAHRARQPVAAGWRPPVPQAWPGGGAARVMPLLGCSSVKQQGSLLVVAARLA
jgi:hypothetical protein